MEFLDWLFQRKKQEHIADISSKLWEKLSLNFIKSKFAESNDSMKYVVDISTNRVVWINDTIQKQFGNVVGEKCHEAFHNSEMPCSFCTNQFLQEGEVYTWIHKNQKLGKVFLVRDFKHIIEGKVYRFENAIDITQHEKMIQDGFRN